MSPQLNSSAPDFVPALARAVQDPSPGLMFTTFAGVQPMQSLPAGAQHAAPPAPAAAPQPPLPPQQVLLPCSSGGGMVQTILVPAAATAPAPGGAATAAILQGPHAVQQMDVDMTEVVAAVETLYRDELRPFGRILRKRLAERAMAMGLGAIDVDVKRLRLLCESCPWLHVQSEEGGDWSALLRDRPQAFADVYSPLDLYPAQLWRDAAAYFASLGEVDMALPGGRYSCAQVLAARRLPFLAGLSLGRVSHIVQLAISQKKLLGYLNGAVVPYARSQSMLKEQCAVQKLACKAGKGASSNCATWDMLRSFLEEVLQTLQGSSIPLSNLKRLFRSQQRLELSETALGYAKLSEALQDERVRDLCSVRLQGHGYAVFPKKVPLQGQHQQQRAAISLADSLPPYQAAAVASAPFAELPATSPQEPARPVPAGASSLRARARWVQELSMEEIAGPQTSPAAVAAAEMPPQPWVPEAMASSRPLSRAGNSAPVFPPTPSPTSVRAGQSLPTLLGSRRQSWAAGAPPHGGAAELRKAVDVVAAPLTVTEEADEQEYIAEPQQLWPATPMTPPSMWSRSVAAAHGMADSNRLEEAF